MTPTRVIPPLGATVYVPDEKRGFRVRARSDRFAVCTKPHFGTVRYFILDADNGVRGTENLVFGMGAETDERCEEMLTRVTAGESEVSHRNRVPWDIVRVVPSLAEIRAAHGMSPLSEAQRQDILAENLEELTKP